MIAYAHPFMHRECVENQEGSFAWGGVLKGYGEA